MASKRYPPEPLISELEYKNPVDRFAQLPEWKRIWLEELTEEKIKTVDEILDRYRDARAVGRFSKWLIVGVFTVFIMSAGFGKNIVEILNWFWPRR
jgi:hypothetical protein